MKGRIIVLVSIFLLVFLLGCVKIYTSPPDSEATVVPEQTQRPQAEKTEEPIQPKTDASENAVEPEKEEQAPLADLVPTEILFDKSTLKVGTTIFFDSGIFNGGDADANGFNIKWFVNGAELGYGGHQGIDAGSLDMTYNSQFYWKPLSAGNYRVEFKVDCDDSILESNEDNNAVFVDITIP